MDQFLVFLTLIVTLYLIGSLMALWIASRFPPEGEDDE